MPIGDDYPVEKELKELSDEVAQGLTAAFVELGCNATRGFILLMFDYTSGKSHYVTDMSDEAASALLRAYAHRMAQ